MDDKLPQPISHLFADKLSSHWEDFPEPFERMLWARAGVNEPVDALGRIQRKIGDLMTAGRFGGS